jgi:hypothetical protein
MLLGDISGVIVLAREALQTLCAAQRAAHDGPDRWPAAEIGDAQNQQMTAVAGRLMADVAPATVMVGKVLYHPRR